MINFITGTVVEINEKQIILESFGIGYEINVSSFTILKKGNIGEKVTILTYLALKEDGLFLYGFYSKEEKELFLKLTSISGIGAKAAFSILSAFSVEELCSLIINQNSKRLSEVKGIGKKTAERIVLELKDKVAGESQSVQAEIIDEDAILALIGMGFSKQEALSKVKSVLKDGMTTEEIILNALKNR